MGATTIAAFSSWNARVVLAACLAFLTVLLVKPDQKSGVVFALAAALPDLKFYMQGHYTNVHRFAGAELPSFMSNETLVGVLAAFHEINAAGGLAGGRNLTLKLFDDEGSPELWVPNTTAAMYDPSLLGAVAPKANDAFFVNSIARQLKMPVFGPTTVDQTELLQSTPNSDYLIHARVPVLSDALASLNYAMSSVLHCTTFMVLYLDEFGIKPEAITLLKKIASLGFDAPVVVGVPFNVSSLPNVFVPLVLAQFLTAKTKPNCGLLLLDGASATTIILGLESQLPAPVFGDLHFFMSSAGAFPVWVNPATGSSTAFRNFYLIASHPSGTDTRFKFIQHYQRAMADFKENGSSPVLSTYAPNVFAVDGYMAARMLIEAIRRVGIGEQVTRQRLKDVVYETKMFQIDDIVLGPFSNGCVGQQNPETGACWCTAGMKRLFFSRVNPATGIIAPVFDKPYLPNIAEVPIPLIQCDIDTASLKRPILAMTARDVNLGVVPGSTESLGNFSDSNPTVKMQSRATDVLRGIVLEAMKAKSLVSGALVALPFDTAVYAPPTHLLASSEVTFTNASLKRIDVRYRPTFLMGAIYDPVKVYPQLGPDAKNVQETRTQSPTSTLPLMESSTSGDSGAAAVHVLDIAPATSAFPDQDEPWRPPAAHLPLRVPFYPTLADLAVTAAAFAEQTTKGPMMRSETMVTIANTVSIGIVADSSNLATIATKSVETASRKAPAVTLVAPVSSAALNPSGSSTTALDDKAVDALFTKAIAAVRSSPQQGQTPSTSSAVIVVTRTKSVMEGAIKAATASTASQVTFVIAADEFVLEQVIAKRSVGGTANETPANVFFTSGLPRYTTSASPDDFRVSATESYGSAIAATVKALYDLSGKTNGSAVEIAAEAYRNLAVPVAAAEISLAPLWAEKCSNIKAPTWPHPGGQCQCAKGLNTFFVRSLKDAVMNTTSARPTFSFHHSGCGPAFKALDVKLSMGDDSSTSATVLVFACVGAAMVILAAAAVGTAFWRSHRQGTNRDNSNAPKNTEDPFTIVFTDIQASTRLWAHAPDRMGEALDVHHRLMREAIKRRRGYEVKTIGDSFMVAFQHPHDALRFAFDTQLMLYSHDMGTDVFDDVYKTVDAEAKANNVDEESPVAEFDTDLVDALSAPQSIKSRSTEVTPRHWVPAAFQHASELSDSDGTAGRNTRATAAGDSGTKQFIVTTPPSLQPAAVPGSHRAPGGDASAAVPHLALPAAGQALPTYQSSSKYEMGCNDDSTASENYAALWSGLRVRIGIHHGTGNIRLDETSQGYDYYGTVVNTAARVEGVGHGGQILVTGAAYECLGDAAVSQLQGAVVDLGPQPLRGLPEPVRLFQVLPEALCARHFPPLRLNVEHDVESAVGPESEQRDTDTGNDSGTTKVNNTSSLDQHHLTMTEIVAELTKKLRLRSPTASRLSIAAAFDAVSTLLAAMKPAGRRETLKALSAAWRVHGVWSGPHMRRLERASALSTEQLTLLATVGRAVQALEVQIGSNNDTTRNDGPALPRATMRQSLTSTQHGNVTKTTAAPHTSTAPFAPGAGYSVVLQVLQLATAKMLSTPTATATTPTAAAVQHSGRHDAAGMLQDGLVMNALSEASVGLDGSQVVPFPGSSQRTSIVDRLALSAVARTPRASRASVKVVANESS